VHQLLIIGICLVMGTWIERGGWVVAPRGRLSVGAFGGMILAFWLLAWCAILFWVGFVFWFHDLPRAGNLGAAIAVGAPYGFAIAVLGVSLGCWMADRERAFQVVGAVSIPVLFLSGFAFPIESIPEPMVWVSFLLPSTHGIQALLKVQSDGRNVARDRTPDYPAAYRDRRLPRPCLVDGDPAGAGSRTADR
jgi:ABC-2 type transport system permease protein